MLMRDVLICTTEQSPCDVDAAINQIVESGRRRELYTPRRTHPHPSLPAWRRKYWEQVRKCKEVRMSRNAASDCTGTIHRFIKKIA